MARIYRIVIFTMSAWVVVGFSEKNIVFKNKQHQPPVKISTFCFLITFKLCQSETLPQLVLGVRSNVRRK